MGNGGGNAENRSGNVGNLGGNAGNGGENTENLGGNAGNAENLGWECGESG